MAVFTVKIPKEGKPEQYLDLPVLDKFNSDIYDNPQCIGVVVNAIELETCIELDICIWEDKLNINREFINGKISAISIT